MANNSEVTNETQDEALAESTRIGDELKVPEGEAEKATQDEQEKKKADKNKQLLFKTEDGKEQPDSGTGAGETETVDVQRSSSNLEGRGSSFIAEDDTSKSSLLGKMKSGELRRSRIWSKTKMAVGSVYSITGQGFDRTVFERKGPRYMNTYKLWSDNPFNPEKVKKVLELVMTEVFEELTYDLDLCANKAKLASASIRQRVKELEFDRYKIISLVTIGERNSQDILVTTRGLWDIERDHYAFFTIENYYLYGIAQCYGLYYE